MVKSGMDDDSVSQVIQSARLVHFDLTAAGQQALTLGRRVRTASHKKQTLLGLQQIDAQPFAGHADLHLGVGRGCGLIEDQRQLER